MKKTITIGEAIVGYNQLASVKLTKFDKAVRLAAIRNFAALKTVVKEYEAFQEALKEKMFEDRKDELSIVSELRNKIRNTDKQEEFISLYSSLVDDYREFLNVEEEFGKELKVKMNDNVEVGIFPVSIDSWIDCLLAGEIDFSPADIEALQFMYE